MPPAEANTPAAANNGRPELLRRTRSLIWVLQVVLIVLAVRAGKLQLACTAEDARQHCRNTLSHEDVTASRGSVHTRDGLVLAQDVDSWRVGLDPISFERAAVARDGSGGWERRVERAMQAALQSFPYETCATSRDPQKVLRRALQILRSRDKIKRDADGTVLKDGRARYVAIGELHDSAQRERFEQWRRGWQRDTGLRGFSVNRFKRREYPLGPLGRQLVGTVSRDGAGLWGLEQVWNSVLEGIDGCAEVPRAASKRFAPTDTTRSVSDFPGSDLVLTIDSRAQQVLEEELQAAHDEWSAEKTLGIVVDPRTGAVLAAASTPLYDLTAFEGLDAAAREKEHARRQQCLTSYQFEPGSTIKSFFLGDVYLHGIDPARKVTDGKRSKKVGGVRWVNDSSDHPWAMTIEESVIYSSNIGLAQVGLILGKKRLRNCLARFRFKERTGIGLAALEWPGHYTSAGKWTSYSTVGIPFGYEISVTLPQLAQAYSALINGGHLVRPHVVAAVRGAPPGALPARCGPEYGGSVFPEGRGAEISRRVREVLRKVAVEGTGKSLRAEKYGPEIELAGKSGTARISEGARGYIDAHRGSFVGFAPASNPRCLVIVVVVKPQGAYYGARVAGPAVRRVLGTVLGAPDQEREEWADQLVRSTAAGGYSEGRD
ncbi:MAG: penicillin-binding protein 2 [Planctomycetota bacterium]